MKCQNLKPSGLKNIGKNNIDPKKSQRPHTSTNNRFLRSRQGARFYK